MGVTESVSSNTTVNSTPVLYCTELRRNIVCRYQDHKSLK